MNDIMFHAVNSKWYEEQLHIDINVNSLAQTVASIVYNAFSVCRKSVQNTSGTRAVKNLTIYEVEVGAHTGRRGVLLAETSITFAVVDQLPAFNKLALRNSFKANHV